MKKCLLFVALCIVSQMNIATAQTLFTVQDTVCINQPVYITNHDKDATSYYWGFCSGYLPDVANGTNIGNLGNIKNPGDINIVKDPKTGNYYGFVTNTTSKEFLRLNFGTSLANTPTVTNFGNLTNVLPSLPTSVFITHDTANWFVFITAGTNVANSCLARIDFGPSLSNPAPNIVSMGNLQGMLDGPRGFFAAEERDGHWLGFLVNTTSSELIGLDFSFNISQTPVLTNHGNLGGLIGSPTDLAAVFDGLNWYIFITNEANSSLSRIDIGGTLANPPSPSYNIGTLNGFLNGPSSISFIKDCGNYYAFITDTADNQLIRVSMPSLAGPYTPYDFGNVGGMNYTTGLSYFLRDHDNIYGFASNNNDSTLTRIEFDQCHNASIPSSIDSIPPAYTYDTPGVYNIYLEVDGGLPTMTTQCKTVTVLPIPPLYITADTGICNNDTIQIHAISDQVIRYSWSPAQNISDTDKPIVSVWPAYSQNYYVTLYYSYGCIVDTSVHIHLSSVQAYAGPDRTIADGATTILGDPNASNLNNGTYTYLWFPPNFLSNDTIQYPVASPDYDMTYYLKVTEYNDSFKCSSIDTVVVHLACNKLAVPNAFTPSSPYSETNTFGILNKEIIKLNYFRIYDRWGAKIFETSDPTQKWDGTVNGKPALEGVYMWTADGFCESGRRFTQTGNVTLLR